jgi:hypothetical protein
MNPEKVLSILKKENYEISTLEQFTHKYVFLKEIKNFIEEIEKVAKKKGFELMSEQDSNQIEFEEYSIIKQDPTITKQYKASKVIEGLGLERAIAFLKVDKAKLDYYLKKGFKDGYLSAEELNKCQENMDSVQRKGFIKLIKKNG